IPYSLKPENGYQPDLDEIQAQMSPRTKLLVVNTPSNPTGASMDRDTIRGLVEIAEDRGIMVVADEVYDFLTYDHPHQSFLSHMENVIWVNSFSKTYALTGWRMGCIATRKEYVRAIETMHYYTVACPPTPFQWAGVAALEGPQDQADRMLEEFRRRRDRIYARMKRIPGLHIEKPAGAFYAFPRYDADVPSEELAMALAKKGLITVPGSAFGRLGEGHLRFSYAVPIPKIDAAMDILESHLAGLPLRK
ncbi:MAG TPA: aminotransferase class I/II-fold pyridoxal phosphate-dependent enzyme, partial [Candidatus Thermoplasmatota archaeon]|nr:aminotransferase class I/II-fold pyridoxal phosphate-dependent enzyme [Candidatus Thermoplasmatota archaeon]